MKKLIYSLLFILFLLPVTALAETKVEVKSIAFIEKSQNTVINNEATTDGEKINLDLIFYDVNDYATYKVIVKNTTNTNLFINDDFFNKDKENIKYYFDFLDGSNIVKAGEEKTFNVKVAYAKEIERDLFRSNNYDASSNEPLILSDKLINIPNTLKNLGILGICLSIVFVLCLITAIFVIFKNKTNSSLNILLIGFLLLMIPSLSNALLRVDIPIDSKIIVKMVKPTYCTFEGNLTQGTTYINGQYIYSYKQAATWNYDSNTNSYVDGWYNITEDGWGVRILDKQSTEPVTTPLCTYINGKPVSNLSRMFYKAKVEEVDFSKWDLSNVTDMRDAFGYSNIKEIDFRGMDTSNIIYLTDLCSNCLNLSKFIAPNLDLSNATDISYMFSHCDATGDVIYNLDNWYFPKVTQLETTFFTDYYNADTVTLHVNNWDVSKIREGTKYFYMFCLHSSKDVMVEAKNWNFNGVTKIDDAFRLVGADARNVSIDVTGWDTSTVTNLNWAFNLFANHATESVTIKGLETWDTSNVTSMMGTFNEVGYYSKSIKMDVSKWDVSKVTTMKKMFNSSFSAADSLDLGGFSSWNLESITDMESFFSYLGGNNYNGALYDIGELNIKHECNIVDMMKYIKGIVVTINLYKKPTIDRYMFSGTATLPGAKVVVNYTAEVDNIDDIVAAKSQESNVIKGELID